MSEMVVVEDVLYVFNAWILMLNSSQSDSVGVGNHIFLLDECRNKVGEAIVTMFLSSRNPKIIPAEISVILTPDNFKTVKYICRDAE